MSRIRHLISGIIAKNRYHTTHRDPSVWVFGEWFGERCCDNSRYFANYIAAMHPDIHAIWISKDSADTSSLVPRVERLTMDSAGAKKALSVCGAAVISQGLKDLSSDGFNYTGGAVSVHLWHGVPWKKIGHDGSPKRSIFYQAYKMLNDYAFGADFYASPSDKYDDIAVTAHGAKRNRIIHAGYPRNSDLYHEDRIIDGKDRIVAELRKTAPQEDFSDVKIISYLPTFRNDSSPMFSFKSIRKNEEFARYLEEHHIIIIEKAHFVNQTRDGQNETGGTNGIYSLNAVAAQDLLCASDLLVTDYSGAFFDYLILDRPIVHYLYDYDHYRTHDRGLYYDKEDVIAGEEASNEDELVQAIIRNMENPNLYRDRRHQIREIYMKYDTEDSCEVLCRGIMNEIKRRNYQ